MGRTSVLRSLYRSVFRRDQYNVGIVRAPIHRFLEEGWRPHVEWLPEPRRSGVFLADPFGVVVDGKPLVLCEYFDYREPWGRIVSVDVDGARRGAYADALVVMSHISYPFLLAHEGQVFCIPETSRLGEIALYGLRTGPSSWRKEAVLLPVGGVDPSMFFHAGKWWLFHGVRGRGDGELFVAYADSPRGPWRSHAKQPVKTDPAFARPGGTPFVHQGRLYRPAQDGSRVYGGRVVINEVVTLSPDEFVERPAAFVEPDAAGPYPDGLHTLSALGDITLIDGKREQFIFAAVLRSARVLGRRIVGQQRPMDL